MATTLYDYYNQQGKSLPSLNDRGQLYQSLGLGTSQDYISQNQSGNIQPNTQLLAALQKPEPQPFIGPQLPKPPATNNMGLGQYSPQLTIGAPQQPTSPVAMLSSQTGQNIANQNGLAITRMEQGLANVPPPITIQRDANGIPINEPSRQPSGTSGSWNAPTSTPANGTVSQVQPPVSYSPSPATASMVSDIHRAAAEGISDPVKLAALQKAEGDAKAALAAASSAQNQGDVINADSYRKQAEETIKQYEAHLADYLSSVQSLRADRAKLAIPGEKEKVINQKLLDLRSSADQFNLQTQKNKLDEYKGQNQTIANARGGYIDIQASFARQEMALKEKNLLLELGLEQGYRESKLKSVETQLSDFSTDYGLRKAVDDKISTLEQNVLDKAYTMQKDQQKILGDLIDNLKGMDLNDLGPAAQKQVGDLAQLAGIPIDLVGAALKATKARVVFEDSIKIANEKSKLATTNDSNDIQSYAQQYASTGQIPTGMPKGSFGEVSAAAKALPKPTGTLVDKNTGIKPGKLNDTQLGGVAAMYDITNKVKELKALDQERWGGLIAGSIGWLTGSEPQQRYVDLQDEIVDLLARARTGAAMTTTEEARYSGQLPGRFNNPIGIGADSTIRLEDFEKKINDSLKSKLAINGLAIYGYSKIKIGGQEYTVGDVVDNGKGQQARINPDGTVTY